MRLLQPFGPRTYDRNAIDSRGKWRSSGYQIVMENSADLRTMQMGVIDILQPTKGHRNPELILQHMTAKEQRAREERETANVRTRGIAGPPFDSPCVDAVNSSDALSRMFASSGKDTVKRDFFPC